MGLLGIMGFFGFLFSCLWITDLGNRRRVIIIRKNVIPITVVEGKTFEVKTLKDKIEIVHAEIVDDKEIVNDESTKKK